MSAIQTALISVSDKTGITELARQLAERGIKIISTGGTARAIAQAGIAVTKVADVTGMREILDGRVKTLHPSIHGGLLARKTNPDDMTVLREEGIGTIDLLVVNLYPFEATIQGGADFATAIENIDIGGPAMIRAAAKNHENVLVATDPADYGAILEGIDNASITQDFRRYLARKAFAATSTYDQNISSWLGLQLAEPDKDLVIHGRHARTLRYGENPHQKADLYLTGDNRPGVALAYQHQGKELSYNNLQDADAAFELIAEFAQEPPTVAIIKHTNPCGAATAPTLKEAYQRALAGDPLSAFGGIVAMNCELDGQTAGEITQIFTEIVIAPSASREAIQIMAQKPNLRLLTTGSLPDAGTGRRSIKSISGGLLVQDTDQQMTASGQWKTVTKRAPSETELDDLFFAWKICKHTRSNAITLARSRTLEGNGCGQTSRVDAVKQAVAGISGDEGGGALVLASDAFFPFADGLQEAIAAGITAVIQPGGAMRDSEVIEAANRAGVAMVFTGNRHFKH